MESTKSYFPVTEKKQTAEKGTSVQSFKKPKVCNQCREKHNKGSMIPVPKTEGGMTVKCEFERKRKNQAPPKCCCELPGMDEESEGVEENEKSGEETQWGTEKMRKGRCRCCNPSSTIEERNNIEEKLKLLQEKEKTIAEYYHKVEELIQNLQYICQKEKGKQVKPQQSQNPSARKIISDPSMYFQSSSKEDILTDLESNVHQISEIWLKTSTDLSSALNNLRNNPNLTSTQFELEKVKIQLALKHTKSLTLIKTRNIITEVKKLFRSREMIRTELENLLKDDAMKCNHVQEKVKKHLQEEETKPCKKKKKPGGTGDSPKPNSTNKKPEVVPEQPETVKGDPSTTTAVPEESKTTVETQPMTEEAWKQELNKKQESITNLNCRIFEMQKACKYHSLLFSQLQAELQHFHEKIQWNQILWKQIGKLKDQIRSLQQTNKQLECQKSELQFKIYKLDEELEKHLKGNEQFILAYHHCKNGGSDAKLNKETSLELKVSSSTNQEILSGKQNAIKQLRSLLQMMKEQEDFAQNQINMFQKKIDELEKASKT